MGKCDAGRRDGIGKVRYGLTLDAFRQPASGASTSDFRTRRSGLTDRSSKLPFPHLGCRSLKPEQKSLGRRTRSSSHISPSPPNHIARHETLSIWPDPGLHHSWPIHLSSSSRIPRPQTQALSQKGPRIRQPRRITPGLRVRGSFPMRPCLRRRRVGRQYRNI